MTCKDCNHFYEREPKPWRTMADIGYCDHSREGKIEINKYCPVNKWCDNKYEPKEERRNARMKCKDCKYFDADKHPTIHGFVSIAGHCDKRVSDGYDEYPMSDCYACDMFEPKEDSWESVSK